MGKKSFWIGVVSCFLASLTLFLLFFLILTLS